MRSPFRRCLTTKSIMLLRIASACRFGISWSSAIWAAICRNVTVDAVAAPFVGAAPFAAGLAAAARGLLLAPVDAFFAAITCRLAVRRFRVVATKSRFPGENKRFRREQAGFRYRAGQSARLARPERAADFANGSTA